MSESMGGIIPECPGDFVGIRSSDPLVIDGLRFDRTDWNQFNDPEGARRFVHAVRMVAVFFPVDP